MASDTQQLLADDVVEFGAENEVPKGRFPHPVALVFHLLFKVTGLVAYILCEFFSSSFVLNFIVLILLLVMDFWTTKNVSGRLLVGLRWWNYIDDDGKSHWMFESKKGKQKEYINSVESSLFWASLFINQIFWIILLFFNILKIKWLVLVIIANALNAANLYGYIRCRMGTGKSLREYATNAVSQQMVSSAFSFLNRSSQDNTESTSSGII